MNKVYDCTGSVCLFVSHVLKPFEGCDRAELLELVGTLNPAASKCLRFTDQGEDEV